MIHKAANSNLLILLFIFISIFILTLPVHSEEYNFSAFGLNFGTSKKDAKKAIESKGYSILREDKDDNDMKIIYFNGTLIDVPYGKIYPKSTELEFFQNKLMSSSIMIEDVVVSDFQKTNAECLKYFIDKHGKPISYEKMLSYKVWTWKLDDITLLVSSNSRKFNIKAEYVYEPLRVERIEEKIDDQRKISRGEEIDETGPIASPARKMFLDGNYSKPNTNPY